MLSRHGVSGKSLPGFFAFYIIFSVFYHFVAPGASLAALAPVTIPTTNILYAVYFVDDNVGYAVGEAGTVIKTVNGGASWTLAASAGGANLNAVYFTDANTGWAVGDDGIFRTTDGAASWPLKIYNIRFDFVAFTPNAARGFAGTDAGDLYWTNDGGNSWPIHPANATFDGSRIVSIEFVDNNNGFLTTRGRYVYVTTDGGVTWSPTGARPDSQLGNLWDASWVDPLHGWVVGDAQWEFARTVDGGNTWITYNINITGDFTALHFSDVNNGWAVMDDGRIATTTNGGVTWTIDPVFDANAPLYDVFVTPGGQVIMVGDLGNTLYVDIPTSLDIVKQAWLVGGTAPLASPVTAPTGSRIIFLIYVRNPYPSQVDDIRILDNLDDTAFDYVEGSLAFGGLADDTAADALIFAATDPTGAGIGASDSDANDLAAACDVSEAACPGTSADRITVGAVDVPPNAQLNIGANSVFGIRYEVIMK